ncbi:MAG: SWIM zinc finger domain-containing protein [Caldilineaceae bacterium]|nr:SWIM zinc finger domain-containing protein [Caldilineaceae bacterium]
MSAFPAPTDAQIRSRTNEKSWARGQDYVEYVSDLVWRDGELSAQVEGSDWEPYHVTVNFDGDEIVNAACTCPYDWGGDCKHIVAALLALREEADEVAQRPPLDELLNSLSGEQLKTVLNALATTHPALRDEIDALADIARKDHPTTGQDEQPADAPALSPVSDMELALLRRQIVADMRGSIRTGYDSWGEEAWYDSDPGEALGPALERIDALLDAGEVADALVLLRAATDAWNEGGTRLDEYFYEYFDESGIEPADGLAAYWAEALLRTELDAGTRAEWIEYLDDQIETALGGSDFEIARTAVEQGWDYPPLVAAMHGNITEQGAWAGDAPFYADELARIRLRILDQRGEHDAYLNLAQAEGEFMAYLHMLTRLERSQEAIAEARKYLTQPRDIHALAQTLRENDELPEAISLARHGLGLDEQRGKDALAAWLRDVAEEHNQPDLALEMAEYAFGLDMTLINYQALERIAGDAWPGLKPAALHALAVRGETTNQVNIFLHEGMHDEAIAAVDQSRYFYDDDRVIESVRATHPVWAFGRCCRRAESIMDAGQAKDYDVAASWLRRGRDILLAAGEDARWREYLAHIMDVHHRKYKLMPMLRELEI